MEEDRGKILIEIKNPVLIKKIMYFFYCWGAFIFMFIGFIYYCFIGRINNLYFDDELIAGLLSVIILFIMGLFFHKSMMSPSDFFPFRIYENGILIPEPARFYFFNEIKTISPWDFQSKNNFSLAINQMRPILSKYVKKGLPIIKNVLGVDWKNKYQKYVSLFDAIPECWSDARNLYGKNSDEIKLYKKIKKKSEITKNCSNKIIFNLIILGLKYEQETGKKIIPDDIKVPDKLYEFAKKIDLDL